MSRILSIILVALTSGVSIAQDVPLEIKGGNVRIIDVDRTIIVKDKLTVVSEFPFMVNMKPGGLLYSWEVPDGVKYKRRGATLQVDHAPNGMLTIGVEAAYIDFDAKKTEVLTGKITFRIGDGPDPVPPKPDPIPPGPVTGSLWIIIIEETNEATPWRGAWFADKALDAEIKAKGHRWRVADKDVKNADGQPPRDLAPWLDRAKGKGLPWLFITPAAGPQAGKMLHDGPLPANPAALVALLRKIGG